jgi:hypothetical protein
MDTILINDDIKKYYNVLKNYKTPIPNTPKINNNSNSNSSFIIIFFFMLIFSVILFFYKYESTKNNKTLLIEKSILLDNDTEEDIQDDNTNLNQPLSDEEASDLLTLIDELSLKNEELYKEYKNKSNNNKKVVKNKNVINNKDTFSNFLNINQSKNNKYNSIIDNMIIESPFY